LGLRAPVLLKRYRGPPKRIVQGFPSSEGTGKLDQGFSCETQPCWCFNNSGLKYLSGSAPFGINWANILANLLQPTPFKNWRLFDDWTVNRFFTCTRSTSHRHHTLRHTEAVIMNDSFNPKNGYLAFSNEYWFGFYLLFTLLEPRMILI